MCRGCYTAYYCSKACQKKEREVQKHKHKEVHKQLCTNIREEFQEVHLEWPSCIDPSVMGSGIKSKHLLTHGGD